MNAILTRLTSRKFLTTLIVQVAAIIALFWPDKADAITATATNIAALTAMLLSALGYATIEASVDKAAMTIDPFTTKTTKTSKVK